MSLARDKPPSIAQWDALAAARGHLRLHAVDSSDVVIRVEPADDGWAVVLMVLAPEELSGHMLTITSRRLATVPYVQDALGLGRILAVVLTDGVEMTREEKS